MNISKSFNVAAIAFAIAFAAVSATFAAEKNAPSPATAALDRHLQAFRERNIDAIMADYTDASVFIAPQGVLKGKAQTRGLFEDLVKEFSSPEAKGSDHESSLKNVCSSVSLRTGWMSSICVRE